MIKLFSSVNEVKNFKIQKKEKRDEFETIHFDSLNNIKDIIDNNNYILCLYEIGKVDVESSFLSEIFKNGINYVNKYNLYNYRSIYNLCKVYEDYTDFKDDIPSLVNNPNTYGYLIILMNEHSLGIEETFIPIYKKRNDNIILLGQYIYGYLPINSKGFFDSVITNNNYTDNYCKENKNLLYEARAEFKIQNQHLSNYHNNKSSEELYNIIVNAYIETLNNFHKKQADYALSLLLEDKVGLFSGEKNKSLLKQYVIYADIKKILATNLNCDENISLEELCEIFSNKYSTDKYVKKMVKK